MAARVTTAPTPIPIAAAVVSPLVVATAGAAVAVVAIPVALDLVDRIAFVFDICAPAVDAVENEIRLETTLPKAAGGDPLQQGLHILLTQIQSLSQPFSSSQGEPRQWPGQVQAANEVVALGNADTCRGLRRGERVVDMVS